MSSYAQSDQNFIIEKRKLGLGGDLSILNNIDITPSTNSSLDGYILTIDNLGTQNKSNIGLVLQKKVFSTLDRETEGFHNKIIWLESPIDNRKEYFKTVSKYSHNFYGELYSYNIGYLHRDVLDNAFFDFVEKNKTFNNENINPSLDYVRFSFSQNTNLCNTTILSGVQPVPLSGATPTYTGITGFVAGPNIYDFILATGSLNEKFVTGNIGTINSITSKNHFIYNSRASGYVVYPQTVYMDRLQRYNVDTVIAPNSINGNYVLDGLLMISTGDHYSQKVVYISPHTGVLKKYNTVVETFSNIPQFFSKNFRCTKDSNPNNPRSCAWTGFSAISINNYRTSSGISAWGIDVNSLYINSGFVLPTGLVMKSEAERANWSGALTTGTWPTSGVISTEFYNLCLDSGAFLPGTTYEDANLQIFLGTLFESDNYKIVDYLKQTVSIKNTVFYKLYSGLYTGNKTFNEGTWNGVIPSGTNVFIEYISTNDRPCGTHMDLLSVHKNYGDNSLQDVAIKKLMGAGSSENNTIQKSFVSDSLLGVDDAEWKNFQKFQKWLKSFYYNKITTYLPYLISETNRRKRSREFFAKEDKTIIYKYEDNNFKQNISI
jgi:hypothetical protein